MARSSTPSRSDRLPSPSQPALKPKPAVQRHSKRDLLNQEIDQLMARLFSLLLWPLPWPELILLMNPRQSPTVAWVTARMQCRSSSFSSGWSSMALCFLQRQSAGMPTLLTAVQAFRFTPQLQIFLQSWDSWLTCWPQIKPGFRRCSVNSFVRVMTSNYPPVVSSQKKPHGANHRAK